jgi:trehalose utilization protein
MGGVEIFRNCFTWKRAAGRMVVELIGNVETFPDRSYKLEGTAEGRSFLFVRVFGVMHT